MKKSGLLLVGVLLFAGCSDEVVTAPDLTLIYGDESYTASKGGYNWEYTSGRDVVEVIADASSMVYDRNMISTIVLDEDHTIELSYDNNPDEIIVLSWSQDDWDVVSEDNATSVEVNGNTIIVEENMLYYVHAIWENETYDGYVDYSFCVNGK